MITYIQEYEQFPLHLAEKQLTSWIRAVAADYSMKPGDINYIFCDDERILAVNRQYLQHDYYTDVITFDYSTGNTLSGDIFISLDTVKSNAEKENCDFQEELHRIIIHGVLHLTGQGDKTDDSRKEMTRKENLALQKWHERNDV